MKKHFPQQYTEPTVNLINAMSISGNPQILGSSSDRTILYSADLDANDAIDWSPAITRKFKEVVDTLESMKNVRITDIKAGFLPEWNIMEDSHLTKGVVLNYNHTKFLDQIESLHDRRIITKEEYDDGKMLIKTHPSPLQFLVAKKALRFGLVRWTPKDIDVGFVKLRDGTTMALSVALQQRSIVKVDVVSWIENRFVECEMVYSISKNGTRLVDSTPEEVKQGIKESLLVFASEHNWIKVAKRLYSLAKQDGAVTIQERLRDVIFNSDLGRLYSILSDARSLEVLREEGVTAKEKERIHQETDGFRARLALITLPPLIKPVDPFSSGFADKLEGILQPSVKEILTSFFLLPIPKKWLP